MADAGQRQKDGLTVGAVAGTPWVEGDELRCDLLISDRGAIEAVKAWRTGRGVRRV